MSNDELFELVAVLTAKNMALEEEIKRLEKQTDRLREDLNQKIDDEEFDFDYPNHYSDPNSASTDLLHKINALESKVVELGESIWKRISRLEASYSLMNGKVYSFGLDISKLKKILIEEEEDNG